MKNLIKKLIFVSLALILCVIPSANAQNYNVSFSGTPTVTFNNNGNQGSIAAYLGGALNLENIGNIGIGNVKVVVKFSQTMIPTNYSGPFDVTFQGSLDPMASDFYGGGNFSALFNGVVFDPGQQYYILFKVMPSNNVVTFTGDTEVVIATTPSGGGGGNTSGGLGFSQSIAINPVDAEFNIEAILVATDLTSYNGLSLIAVVDNDEIELPYTQVLDLTSLLPDTFDTGGNNYIPVDFDMSIDPTGYYFQFFLVDTQSLGNNGGTGSFNSNSSSSYATFISTTIANPSAGGSQPGDDMNPGGSQPGDLQPFNFESTIANPLGQDMNIIDFLQKLFVNIVKIAFPFLVLFMMYAGFMFVEARGNDEKLKKAKKNFFYVVIGALLVLGAWTIASILKGTVDEIAAPVVLIEFINNIV